MVDRIADPWGSRTPYGPGEPWPVRVDRHLAGDLTEADVDRWVQSASVLHSNGDAMDIAVADGRIVGVRGRAVDRINRGRLGPKDLYGWQANNSPDRLTRPLVRDGDRLVETDWDIGLLRDLQDLYLMAAECDIAWTVVGQAAYGARDEELLAVVERCEAETAIQLKWLRTRMKAAAPQALVVAD
ncbi:hypothetical protein [Micromonospora sp. NPDC048063]|uniref:hypothetical protein n=1 Tax=Micromonospora sp. NPDC048063 TaxID=3364256 RepID=UPI003720B6C7